MQQNEREPSNQDLWKSQEEEPMHMTTAKVCARAHKYERENVIVYWAVLSLVPVFLAGFIYNLTRLREPLLLTGSTLAFVTFGCMFGKLIWRGPHRMPPAEPCLHFLRRKLEAKRRGLLWIRGCLLLLVPGIGAALWGGGPLLRAKTLGAQSPWLLSALRGPGPWIVMASLIAFEWFAFSTTARKVEREIEKPRSN
jgi:hypothetical protein